MSTPQEVYERIARTWERGGGRILQVVSVCHTERGALRAAKRYPYAEVLPPMDGGTTWTVWAVRDDDD